MARERMSPDIEEQVNSTVESYIYRHAKNAYDQLQKIINGEIQANYDTKRNLCLEVNRCIDFDVRENRERYPFYSVDKTSGKILTEKRELPPFYDSTLQNGEIDG